MADKSFPELPEVPMWRIFNNLPTVDLLSTDRVSTSWSAFTQRESTLNRKSLTLFLGDPKPRYLLDKYGQSQEALVNNKFDVPYMADLKDTTTGGRLFPDYVPPLAADTWENLTLKTLTGDLVEQLLKLFPEPTNLVVSTAPGAFTEPLLDLLNTWSGTLTSFKLYTPSDPLPSGRSEYDDSYDDSDDDFFEDEVEVFPDASRRLLATINSMSSLRHLTLQWCAPFLPRGRLAGQIDLPILRHLEELYFYCYDIADALTNSLQKYGQSNANLRVIALRGYFESKHNLTFALPADFIATRFKQLNFSLRGVDREWFEFSPRPVPYFAALTSLDLNIAINLEEEPFSLAASLRYLEPLKQLLYLKLTLTGDNLRGWRRELAIMKRDDNFSAIEDGRGNWLTVPSLKVLNLDFINVLSSNLVDRAIMNHGDLRGLQLYRFFPAVQALQLSVDDEDFACSTCRNKSRFKRENDLWIDVCLPPMVNWARHFKDLLFVKAEALAYSNKWKAEKLIDDGE